jgi:LssY C-terminus
LKAPPSGRPNCGKAAQDAGISRRTGQITHRIAPDIDAERDWPMADLAAAGQLARQYEWPGIGVTEDRRNAGGDRYSTDGMITVGCSARRGALSVDAAAAARALTSPPIRPPRPPGAARPVPRCRAA